MAIIKQITICKSETSLSIYPESKNEIGLYVAHTPCFTVSMNDIRGVENIIDRALQNSNSGIHATEDTAKDVLKELHIKSWNRLYKSYKIIALSLTDEHFIVTPYIYTTKGMFPNSDAKIRFNIGDYENAVIYILEL